MSEKITVPTLGESVTEATVSKWLKSQGEKVTADEPIVELETDKVNVEVPAPANGILGSIDVKEGETVNVGSLLGTISKNTNQSNNTVHLTEKIDPVISNISILNDNTFVTITFSEEVFTSSNGSGNLVESDFTLSLSNGIATLNSTTPTSIVNSSPSSSCKKCANDTPLDCLDASGT